MKSRHASTVGFCEDHGKLLYGDRRSAKNIARQHTAHMNVYRCDLIEQYWHVGHLAEPIIRGEIDRETLYREAS